MTRLYVGNLSFSATEDSVRESFAAHDTVVNEAQDEPRGGGGGYGRRR